MRLHILLLAFATTGCLDVSHAPATTTPADPLTGGTSTTDVDPDDSSETTTTTSTTTDTASTSTPSDDSSTGSTPDPMTTTPSDRPFCGDGHLDPGEQCDNGVAGNDDGAYCLVSCKLATCGDGHLFSDNEECDDQNNDPADGCHTCFRTRTVFVTSQLYQGADFLGLAGADQRCRSLAAQAGLQNAHNFKAWLSDSRSSARQRLYPGPGRYELVNGLPVADSWAALLEGKLLHPINVTEKSETSETVVCTGTNPDGTTADGTNHCADWTSENFADDVVWGVSDETTPNWTHADSPANPGGCSDYYAIYCFEQE